MCVKRNEILILQFKTFRSKRATFLLATPDLNGKLITVLSVFEFYLAETDTAMAVSAVPLPPALHVQTNHSECFSQQHWKLTTHGGN